MTLVWNESYIGNNVTNLNSNETDIFLLTNILQNSTTDSILYPLGLVIPITVVYAVIFVTGVVGNVSTCIVISRNKSMHTATNYYLFSLAVSDMLLLISGLPPEMYRIWSPETYVFGEAFCVLQGFAAETSANATVLTITAFTVERYLAICHPFLSHTMSKLSRVIRYIITIWVIALCLAIPQAIQFGVEYESKNDIQLSRCTVVFDYFDHAFEISTFLFFVGPMTLITVLYVLIGIQLRKSRDIAVPKRPSLSSNVNNEPGGRISRNTAAQNRVVKMLIAVVAAFFICWAPFHAQRLFAVYLANASEEAQETSITIYMTLMYASGILYFLSTTINPVLYHIMSNKFREAFTKTFSDVCRTKRRHSPSRTYSVLSKYAPSIRNFQRSVSDDAQHHINEELTMKNTANKHNHFLGYSKGRQNSTDAITENNRRRVRILSESSQTTTLSTLTKTASSNDCVLIYKSSKQNNINTADDTTQKLEDKDKAHNDKYLRIIRWKMFKIFEKENNHINNQFYRQNSVVSTNTISNSSLQDMDEVEFSTSDLVKYMEEINDDLA